MKRFQNTIYHDLNNMNNGDYMTEYYDNEPESLQVKRLLNHDDSEVFFNIDDDEKCERLY